MTSAVGRSLGEVSAATHSSGDRSAACIALGAHSSIEHAQGDFASLPNVGGRPGARSPIAKGMQRGLAGVFGVGRGANGTMQDPQEHRGNYGDRMIGDIGAFPLEEYWDDRGQSLFNSSAPGASWVEQVAQEIVFAPHLDLPSLRASPRAMSAHQRSVVGFGNPVLESPPSHEAPSEHGREMQVEVIGNRYMLPAILQQSRPGGITDLRAAHELQQPIPGGSLDRRYHDPFGGRFYDE